MISGRPDQITKVLFKGRPQVRERKMLAFKTEEKAGAKECRWFVEAEEKERGKKEVKKKKKNPTELSRRNISLRNEPMLSSNFQNPNIINFCCFKSLN